MDSRYYSKRNNGSNDEEGDAHDLGSGLATFFDDFIPYNNNGDSVECIGIKYAKNGLTYREWRGTEKKSLMDYLSFRAHREEDYHNHNQTDNSSISSSSDYDSSTDEDEEFPMSQQPYQPESQIMETQEPFVARQQQSQLKSPNNKKRRRRRQTIPNINECLHDVSKLEYLDLYTQSLSLSLSKIVKVWKLRDTKRRANSLIAKPIVEIWQHSRSTPSRRMFEEIEEDGPIATAYKQVMHLEIRKLQLLSSDHLPPFLLAGDTVNNQSRQRPMRHQRIKVFFYNSYATAVSEWIQQQRKQQRQHKGKNDTLNAASAATTTTITQTTDIIMNISNVPAICIYPYTVDPRNWKNKDDLVEYCLCIGDESIARRESENIRFDSEDMEIRLMAVKKSKINNTNVVTNADATSELILSRCALAKDFLSSSEERISEDGASNQNNNAILSPLQNSWKLYQDQIDNNKQRSTAATSTTTNQRRGIEQDKTDPPLQDRGKETENIRAINAELPDPTSQLSRENELQHQPQRSIKPIIFEGATKRQLSIEQTKYYRLGDIRNIINENEEAGRGWNATINIYAAVQGLSPPRITKRGDWMITVTLIDDSCTTPVVLNIFCKQQSHLPKVAWMGDIIRVHRARVDVWKGEIQFQGLKSSSYVVVRKTEQGWKAFPTANVTSSFNRSDEERSQGLWHWAKCHMKESPSIKPDNYFTLADMSSMRDNDEKTIEDRDITVMVVEINRYSTQSSGTIPQGFLRVWDGTGYPPSDPLFMRNIVSQSGKNRRISQSKAVERAISTTQQLQESNLTMEIPKSLCGRISNVAIWEKSHWNQISEHISVGTFLRLRNVHIRKWQDNMFRSIFIHDRSWLTALPDENFEVRSLLLKHNDRVRRGEYNREFGLHPNFKFGGGGLSCYRNQNDVGVFTGAIHLLKAVSSDMQALIIADRSGSLKVMIGDEIRKALKDMIEITDLSFDSSKRFLAIVRSFKYEDNILFFLTNLAPCN